jgi:hypothetical protein
MTASFHILSNSSLTHHTFIRRYIIRVSEKSLQINYKTNKQIKLCFNDSILHCDSGGSQIKVASKLAACSFWSRCAIAVFCFPGEVKPTRAQCRSIQYLATREGVTLPIVLALENSGSLHFHSHLSGFSESFMLASNMYFACTREISGCHGGRVWRCPTSGMPCCAEYNKVTDVSEVLTAPIIKAPSITLMMKAEVPLKRR